MTGGQQNSPDDSRRKQLPPVSKRGRLSFAECAPVFACAAAGHPEPGRVGPGSVSSPYSMQALALTWGRPGSAGKTVGALLSLRRRGGEVAKQSRVL